MSTNATLADGSATEATATPSQELENALRLFDAARDEQRRVNQKVADMQKDLVTLLEADFAGTVLIDDGSYHKHFTVVRAHDEVNVFDEKLVLRVGRKLRMLKRFTRTVVDWTAVRAAVDSGLFPELAGAVTVEQKPKKPYIKIS